MYVIKEHKEHLLKWTVTSNKKLQYQSQACHLFDHLLKHFQEAWFLPESHQSIDEHACKFRRKRLMHQYMKNKPIKLDLKFWF